MRTIAPYGSWKSPISAEMAAVAATPFSGLWIDGAEIYWVETRPQQAGRYAIMHRSEDGSIGERTPLEFSARSTVHEYGGGAFAVSQGTIFFCNHRDQRIYRQRAGSIPEALTPSEGYRYADLVVDRARRRLICVREDHTAGGEARNTLVSISLKGSDDGTVIASGNDFYSNPRLSPDGTLLAFLTWNHPNMPWDGCELHLAPVLADGKLGDARLIAGGPSETIFQPEWSPDGVLHFVAEPDGWWNLYRWENDEAHALCSRKAEFGRPMWMFGSATYGFLSAGTILCCYTEKGIDHLARLDVERRQLTTTTSPFTDIDFLRCGNGMATFIGGSPVHPYTVVMMDTSSGRMESIKASFEVEVDEGYLSKPENIEYPTANGRSAHAFYYAPTNKDFAAPDGERAPLIVMSHGGPTSAAATALRYMVQYWTSRGFAVVDVNYGGSVGYGLEYRRRLNGQWGIVDVDDCCNAALYLASRGLVDRQRLAVRGSSAGGFTTFACLTFRNDVFRVGAALFGVADLETFVRDTHKFESRYLSTLVGPYPDRKDLYYERSPINFAANLKCPLILFQGDEDKIVPPSQSQRMFEAVRLKGLPTAYILFQGEQHGFRKAASLRRLFEAELYFYSRIFGFRVADDVEPVEIENLPAAN